MRPYCKVLLKFVINVRSLLHYDEIYFIQLIEVYLKKKNTQAVSASIQV